VPDISAVSERPMDCSVGGDDDHDDPNNKRKAK
jgi:hypothetical protein